MWSRCDHISLYYMHETIKYVGVGCVDENNAGFSSAFGRGFILSGDCTGEEGCAIPLAPGEPSAVEEKVLLAYCHALSSSNASEHLLYQQTSIPLFSYSLWTARQADTNQITFSPPPVGAFSPPCTLLSCLVWLSEEAQSARGTPGWEGSQPLAAKGCGSPRISAWPAGMGSVSSVLARSRNTVVQPGSSPPQPEAQLAAPVSLKDSRSQRRALRHQGSFRPSPAWEPPLAKHSRQELPKLENAELSPVLRRLPTMSQSSPRDSPGGEFCG